METTQLEKSQTFALNFASMLALQIALKEVGEGVHVKATKEQLENTILEAVEQHPQPAEA